MLLLLSSRRVVLMQGGVVLDDVAAKNLIHRAAPVGVTLTIFGIAGVYVPLLVSVTLVRRSHFCRWFFTSCLPFTVKRFATKITRSVKSLYKTQQLAFAHKF